MLLIYYKILICLVPTVEKVEGKLIIYIIYLEPVAASEFPLKVQEFIAPSNISSIFSSNSIEFFSISASWTTRSSWIPSLLSFPKVGLVNSESSVKLFVKSHIIIDLSLEPVEPLNKYIFHIKTIVWYSKALWSLLKHCLCFIRLFFFIYKSCKIL